MVVLFGAAIFLSAFLLFWIQPLFAKMALPLLGGAPAVWNTAMVFYQTALLAGYAYAHFSVARLGVRRQVALHLTFLVLPAVAIPVAIERFGVPTGSENPALWMLQAMSLTVGLPYLAIAATSPLVQRWFAATGHRLSKDPYFLYVASNAGSMLALVAFPLWLEPNLSTGTQSTMWAACYVVLAVLLAVCGLIVRRKANAGSHEEHADRLPDACDESVSWRRKFRWIFLAAVPCSLMLGVTTHASTDIAVVPMFWVAPLALYLLSFIVVFAKRPPIPHRWSVAALPMLLAGIVFTLAVPIDKPAWLILSLHLTTFFIASLVCHGEVARDRPSAARLTEFYLLMSVGGAIGGAFNALLAPILFVSPIEYALALLATGLALPVRDFSLSGKSWLKDALAPMAMAGGLVAALLLEREHGLMSSRHSTVLILGAGALCCVLWTPRPWRFAAALAALIVVGKWQDRDPRHTLFAGRSFFGVHKVVELPGSQVRHLQHGRITHGTQNFKDGMESEPQSYFARSGPLGKLIAALNLPKGARVGVIGLGVGTVAAYARPGDHWTFFEIDPVVARIAEDPGLFTFLAHAKGRCDVVLGDGRLTLSRSPDRFDLLILDAFSSDAIPAHLLTKEAFAMYRSKLKPSGAIAVNVTNKHLDLEPLIGVQGRELGFDARICRDWDIDPKERRNGKAASTWAALAPSRSKFAVLREDAGWLKAAASKRVALWTDDHSSVLELLTSL